ncbi:MAG: AMP-binding protein [Mycobacterium kyogaense]|uniref:class I adenylate-forming enzyme family protein n=1 Tax=Mycobacterium kyogaense TaxID=2212479 RepID=UPI002FFBE94C
MTVPPERVQQYEALGSWTEDRVGDLVPRQAATHPDRELFLFQGRRVTYLEFDSWVTAVASDMVRRGVTRGDRVVVQLPNCLEALVVQVAALRIGALDVPVIPIYRQHETRQILADTRPSVVAAAATIGDRRPPTEIDHLLAELGHQPAVRYLVGGVAPGWSPVPDDISGHATLPDPAAAHEPAVILYTSGTTSAPKGAVLSSRSLLAQLRNMTGIAGLDHSTVVAVGTPLSHLSGLVAGLLLPVFLGARAVILPAWRPDEAVDVIATERVTTMMGATVFLQDLVSAYTRAYDTDHRLTAYMCAGATIPPGLIRAAAQVGIFATRHYGMTETAGICTGATADDPIDKRESWDGRLLAGMEIDAVDEHHRPVAPGHDGELRIRGPQLFDGYTDTAVTTAQFDDDGWFYPGDRGIVEDGWVRMTGRSKDIVNRGGEKFSTQDIEAALLSHPDVRAAAVTAVPDSRFGEAVGAWIVLADGVAWTGHETYVRHLHDAQLAKAKLPVEWHVVESIPTTASGKVQKFRLRELTDLADSADVSIPGRA